MKKILSFSILLFFTVACSLDPLKFDSSPMGDFELFFKYLKNDYSYRDAKYQNGKTMESLRAKYLPMMLTNPTYTTFWGIVYSVIELEIRDPHLQFPPIATYEELKTAFPTATAEKERLDALEGRDSEYPTVFNEINLLGKKRFYEYGTAKANPSIGYVHINNFNEEVGGSSSTGMHPDIQEINIILDELNTKGVKTMIVDIRSPAGGTNEVPRYIAARFANKTYPYMVEEYPEGTGFKTKKWTVTPSNETGFRTGKIALLSNGGTCSGGEFFTMMMIERGNVIHIGSNSLGCAGNVTDRPLAIGISIRMTNSRTTRLDGTEYVKVGITPKDFIVKNPSTFGKTTFEDQVLVKAIKELSK